MAGEKLEDGRPVDTSSKYQKAKTLQEANKPVKIISEDELLAMVSSATADSAESKATELPPATSAPMPAQPVAAELLGNELWTDKYA